METRRAVSVANGGEKRCIWVDAENRRDGDIGYSLAQEAKSLDHLVAQMAGWE